MIDVKVQCLCKDCNHFESWGNGKGGYCYMWNYEQGESPNSVEENDFCSYAEKK